MSILAPDTATTGQRGRDASPCGVVNRWFRALPSLFRWTPLVFAFAGCTCAPTLRTTRTPLATVPADFDTRSFVVSDDGASYAYVTREDDLFHVVHDGQKGPAFLEVTEPRMAPGTHQVFYWGTEDGGGKPKITLVAGDAAIPTALEKPGQIAFSASGGHWAALGGTAIRTGEGVARGPVILYRDGREVGSFRDATPPAVSRDGQHVAVLAEPVEGQIALVVDEQVQQTFRPPQVNASPLIRPHQIGSSLAGLRVDYLADGTLLFLTPDESGWALYRDATRIASYKVNVSRTQGLTQLSGGLEYASAIASDQIGFAAAAPVAAWWERLEGASPRWRVVRNGVPIDDVVCAKSWEHDVPILSSDGSQITYACPRFSSDGIEQAYVVFEGRLFGPYAGVWGLTLSPDGRHFAYAADDDAPEHPWRYVVDGAARATRYDRVWPPRYSADGRLLFWVAQPHERVVLMVNGSGRASSDAVAWVPKMNEHGVLWWITQRGTRLHRIEISAE